MRAFLKSHLLQLLKANKYLNHLTHILIALYHAYYQCQTILQIKK